MTEELASAALANMDLVFFVYGAAFIMLGLTALWSPAEHSDHPIAAELGWLAAFGLSHGVNEWVAMWQLIQGTALPAPLPFLLLAGSFACLLEFGRRLLREELGSGDRRRHLAGVVIYLPLLAGLAVLGLGAGQGLAGWHMAARYFLGFPAGLLAAAALVLSARHMVRENRPMAWAGWVGGGAMAAYAVLSGLVVDPTGAAIAPFTTEGFQARTGLPVQLLRAAAAMVLALSLGFLFRRFNAEVRDKLAQLATTFRTSQAIMITDADGVIERVNRAFTRTTGYRAEEVIGQEPRVLKSGYQDDEFYQAMWHQLHAHGYWEGEIWDRLKDGRVIPIYEAISTIPGEDGGVAGYVSVFHDISRQKELEAELERQATFDYLTGLYKRHPLEQFIQQEIRRGRRFGTPFSLVMADIDHFKAVNDEHGHDIGDEVLKVVAGVLTREARAADIPARWGGEEFMVLLPDTDTEGASQLAERLRLAVATTDFPVVGPVTVSLGVAALRQGDGLANLTRRVDTALYRAKAAGRNRVARAE